MWVCSQLGTPILNKFSWVAVAQPVAPQQWGEQRYKDSLEKAGVLVVLEKAGPIRVRSSISVEPDVSLYNPSY